MLSKFSSSKTGRVILFIFVIAIIASFALTTDTGQSIAGARDVAVVGDQKITQIEYRRAIEQTKNFYQQFFKGQALSQDQLRKIEQESLDRLVNQKVLGQLGKELNLSPSKNQISENIKKLPYFLTNEKFDLSKYKSLLRANGINPNQFEKQMADDIMTRSAQGIISGIEVSDNYAKELDTIKENGLKATGVILEKSKLVDLVQVTSSQIKDYLEKKDNKTKVENLYISNNKRFSSPEKVKASHILIRVDDKTTEEQALKKIKDIQKKLTVANFANMANKFSQDAHGGNGGSLGEFTRGRMVAPFEKIAFSQKENTISNPVKTQFGYHIIHVERKISAKTTPLKEVEKTLAKELIQKENNKELDNIFTQGFKELKTQQEQGKTLQARVLSKAQKVNGAKISLIEPRVLQKELPNKEALLKAYFENKDTSLFHHNDGETAFVLKLERNNLKKSDDENKKKNESTTTLQRELSQKVLELVKSKTKISFN